MEDRREDIFKNGSVWLKADLHLHTKADTEFEKIDDVNQFTALFISQLKKQNIGVGLIANHNKFDLAEFKDLRKNGLKQDIFFMPGTELSVNDGSNGIHVLVAYEYETWVKGNDNFIDQFLNSAFEGIPNRENSSSRCKYNLSGLFKKLEEHRKEGRDSFVIMAHIEQANGFYNELDGGRIGDIVKDESFKKNVLAFQKLRTNDIKTKLAQWAGGEKQLPAFVEGSDCKKIDEAGDFGTQKNEHGNSVSKACYIKIGDFNFEAVKYALSDKENRVVLDEVQKLSNAYVKSIRVEGGLLDGKELNLSPELNNFIGIRGSGKSAIIEILRYSLGIPLGNQSMDRKYKDELIDYALSSGAKITVNVVNKHGKEYRIEKIKGHKEEIFENGNRITAAINAVFASPVYYGQKDLSNKDVDFEADLVNKLIGNRLENIKRDIQAKTEEIKDLIASYRKLVNLEEQKKETSETIKNAEEQLKIFKEKGVEEKLRLQANYDADITSFSEISKGLTEFNAELNSLIENNSTFFKKTSFSPKENKDIFSDAERVFNRIAEEFNKLNDTYESIKKLAIEFNDIGGKLRNKKEGFKEEFAKIKRGINIPNLNPDDFLKFKRQIETSRIKLTEIEKSEKKRAELLKSLHDRISELNNLWHEEFKIIEKEVARINSYKSTLSIEPEFKGRRDKLLDKMKQVFKGSGITETSYGKICDKYKDFVEIYRDIVQLNNLLNQNQLAEFNKRFMENLAELLTYQVETRYVIKYGGKPLDSHSLGQRATALILFLLTQKETDILVIDQPEDDLDNQTIYEDVIKEIKALKGKMQFIFATHNANIPVLGDSEKLFACKFSDDKIEVQEGTIDHPETQKQIVTIMEGGEEAFNRRKNIYELWSKRK